MNDWSEPGVSWKFLMADPSELILKLSLVVNNNQFYANFGISERKYVDLRHEEILKTFLQKILKNLGEPFSKSANFDESNPVTIFT